jgi:hypothetical protein
MGGVLLANAVMRRAKARWPGLGTAGIIGVAMVFCMAFDFVLETIWMRLGIYTYAGSIRWLTLFSGHYYQFPIYEVVFAGGMFTAFACVRYFQNDKGLSVAERGVDELRVSRRARTSLRFLAIVGIINVLMLVTYNLPMQWLRTPIRGPRTSRSVRISPTGSVVPGPSTRARAPPYRFPDPTRPI